MAASVILAFTALSANAQYSGLNITDPYDIEIKAYLDSMYTGPNINYYVWFWQKDDGLTRSFQQNATLGGTTSMYYYSDHTRIAYATFYNGNEVRMNYICPKNQTDKIKRHINIMKAWDVQVGQQYTTKPACPVPVLPTDPAQQPKPNTDKSTITNSTTLAQVQGWYPLYEVTRLFPTRDIFKVYCVYGACDQYRPWWDITGHTMYLSNSTVIGRRLPDSSADLWNYVRTTDTVTSQVDKDNINFLAYEYFHGYVNWISENRSDATIWW